MCTKDWHDVFSTALHSECFTQVEIQQIYKIEMEARTFFDFAGIVPDFLILQNIERDSQKIQYYWESRSIEAICPFCGTMSNKECKDYFTKPLQDMPQDRLAVYHVVCCKKYFCENPNCLHTRFVERLDGYAEEDARKTICFKKFCVERSLESGCKPAEDALKREGALVSNDSIARYLKVESAKKIESNLKRNDVKVLAIDDINLCKGDKSTGCTVLLDEETHRVLLIIRGTTKEAAKKAIDMFPAAEFFSRDRASAYASAATECGKTQIADRFHLIKNAHTAVEEALMTSIPATIFIREGDGWVQATQSDDMIPVRPYFYVPEEKVEESIRLAMLTESKAEKYRNTLKILELADKGVKTADIANTLNIPLKDVRLLRRTAVSTLDYVDEKMKSQINSANESIIQHEDMLLNRKIKTLKPKAHPSHDSIVEPYRETIIAEVKKGGNHRTIHPILQSQGFNGSCNAVYQYILKLRKEEPEEIRKDTIENPPELKLENISRDTVYKQVLKNASESRPKKAEVKQENASQKKLPEINSPLSDKAKELIYGVNNVNDSTQSKGKENEEKKLFEKIVALYPVIMILVSFLSDCYKVFDDYSVVELDSFITKYKSIEIAPLAQYASGLLNDYEAVKNSLIYKDISNGPIEGINSRIKMKHRRGGGRAGIELINAYNVLKASDLAG